MLKTIVSANLTSFTFWRNKLLLMISKTVYIFQENMGEVDSALDFTIYIELDLYI